MPETAAGQSAQSSQSQPSPEPTAIPEPTASPASSVQTKLVSGDPVAIFPNPLTATNALTAYRAYMDQTVSGMLGAQGKTKIEVQAEIQAMDRISGDFAITLTGEPPIKGGFVIIGDDP